MLRVCPPFVLVVAALAGGGCGGGGVLSAHLEAAPVDVTSRDSVRELRFVAEASTSDAVTDGDFGVEVRAPAGGLAGQVRVTVVRGDDLAADPAPAADVVQCKADEPVIVHHAALAGPAGHRRQPFVIAFAPEGLDAGVTVQLPVVVDAQLVYENAPTAPAGDFLRLTLE